MDPLESMKALHLEMLGVSYKLTGGPSIKDIFTKLETVSRRLNLVRKT
jgi:hypothetical protein